MHSDLSLTVLKSYTPLRASLSGLKHLLLALGLMAVIAGVGLVYMNFGQNSRAHWRAWWKAFAPSSEGISPTR